MAATVCFLVENELQVPNGGSIFGNGSRLLIWQKGLRSVGTNSKNSSVLTSVLEPSDFEYTPKMTKGWMDEFWMFLGSCGYFLCKSHLLEPIVAPGSSRRLPRHEN